MYVGIRYALVEEIKVEQDKWAWEAGGRMRFVLKRMIIEASEVRFKQMPGAGEGVSQTGIRGRAFEGRGYS